MPDLFERGAVILDGPDGVDVAMTPDAAIETTDRLLKAGLEAAGQQLSDEIIGREHEKRLRPGPKEPSE